MSGICQTCGAPQPLRRNDPYTDFNYERRTSEGCQARLDEETICGSLQRTVEIDLGGEARVILCERHALDAARALHGAAPGESWMCDNGCPHKRISEQQVYFAQRGDLFKIGFSTNWFVRTSVQHMSDVHAALPGTKKEERELHRLLDDSRASVGGEREWFRLTPLVEEAFLFAMDADTAADVVEFVQRRRAEYLGCAV